MPVIDFTAAEGGILRIHGFLRRGLSIEPGYGTGVAVGDVEGEVALTEADDVLVAEGTWFSGIGGTLNLAEEADTVAAAGSSATGTVAVTEDEDTLAASATAGSSSASLVLEDNDDLLLEIGDLLLMESGSESKVTALSDLATLTADDLVYVLDDPAGTPADRKVTVATLTTYILS